MINKKLGLMALIASCAAGQLMAANTLTNYTTGDVLVCFRNTTYDLVVDAGPIASLTNHPANTRVSISQYTGSQLAAFGGVNSATWSAFTWLGDYTLYLTKPRPTLNKPTTPYLAGSQTQQNYTESRMEQIPSGAAYQFGVNFNASSSSTAVIEPNSNSSYVNGLSYATAIGSDGSFNGTFLQADPESTTPSGFSAAGTVQQADFYQMSPTTGFAKGALLGYFELASDGTMVFVVNPSTIPVIKSISRSGNVATINYTTGTAGTYTLRGISSLTSGTPMASWPAIATLPNASSSTVQQYMDTDSSNIKFYAITAQ